MADPMARITEARADLRAAKRSAQAAWNLYTEQEKARCPAVEPGHNPAGYDSACRAQAATHLPEDMLELLGIDRYGSAR